MAQWFGQLYCMLEVRSSNPTVVTGICDPEEISSTRPSKSKNVKKLEIVQVKKLVKGIYS